MKSFLLLLIGLTFSLAANAKFVQPVGETESNYSMQCWQDGVKIIDENNLSTYQNLLPINSNAGTNAHSISFDKNNKKVILIDSNKSTCIIKEMEHVQ